MHVHLLRHTVNLESALAVRHLAVVTQGDLLLGVHIRNRVALTVAEIDKGELRCIVLAVRELERGSNVAGVVARRRHLEAVVARVRALPVDDEELVLAVVLLLRLAGAELVIVVAQSVAVSLKGQVAALAEVTARRLVTLLNAQRLGLLLLAVRHLRLNLVAVTQLAHPSTIVLASDRVLVRSRNVLQLELARVVAREVKGLDQVAQVLTAPRVNSLRVEGLAVRLRPLLEEEDLALVSSMLGEDTTVTGPGRDDVEGKTEARAGRRKACRRVEGVRHPLALSILRRVGAHNVVSPTASLVVGNQEGSVVPVLAVHHSLCNLALEPSTVVWAVWRVLGKVRRRNDVGDFRQIALLGILVELFQARVAHGMTGQGSLLGGGLLVLLPLDKRVTTEVVKVLVELERDVRLLQILGHRLPSHGTARVRATVFARHTGWVTVVLEDRTALLPRVATGRTAVKVDRAREPRHTVRVRRRNNRLVVRVRHGEVASQTKVDREVVTAVVADRVGRVGDCPLVDLALVPRGMVRQPHVATRHHALSAVLPVTSLVVEVPGHELRHILGRLVLLHRLVDRLVEDTLTGVLRDVSVRVLETTHTLHCTEVVVKCTILLHKEDDVLDLLQAVLVRARRRERCEGSGGHKGAPEAKAGHGS